jgi:membrane associated rhomboid family serine protease
MTPTPVGMRCPECSRERTRVVRLRNVRREPYVTFALIAINVIAFLAEEGQFGISRSQGLHGPVVEEGWLYRAAISQGDQYWRLLTSGFLHVSITHVGFNMLILYFVGRMLEPAIGSARFAAIYFTSLLAGSFGALLATPGISLGASGAIFGLLGAAVVEVRSRRMSVMESGIGGLIIFNLLISFVFPDISIGAHIGGLIGGFLAGLAVRTADDRHMPALGFVGCLLISAISVLGSIAVAGATGPGFA